MRQLWLATILGVCQASVDLDFGETNVAMAEKTRAIYSLTPSGGTAMGGTRISIGGEGFATDFWNGGNTVHIGGVPCDVVEGACTVDCGGSTRIVRDHIPHSLARARAFFARERDKGAAIVPPETAGSRTRVGHARRASRDSHARRARRSARPSRPTSPTDDDRAAARLSYRYATLASGRQTRTAAGRRSR